MRTVELILARADIRIRIRGRIVRVHVSEPVIRAIIRVTANIRASLRNLYVNELLKAEWPSFASQKRDTPRH